MVCTHSVRASVISSFGKSCFVTTSRNNFTDEHGGASKIDENVRLKFEKMEYGSGEVRDTKIIGEFQK